MPFRNIVPGSDSMRLPAQTWMTAPWVEAVFDALSAGSVRFVGGCVRDAVLHRPIKDVDLATDLLPQDVAEAAEAAGLKAVPTGIEHGTVTVISDHHPVEVTTLRKDVETDGRRAVVAFTDDWREDALRRDLTINALSMDRDGAVHDFFGGVADARAGHIRFVGDPDERIREDALRILRFFRFYAHYGLDEPDAAGFAACGRLVGLLKILSAERVQQELLRLLAAADPLPALRLMDGIGVWRVLEFAPVDLGAVEALAATRAAAPDPVLRLAALAGPAMDPAVLAESLRLSNADRGRLSVLQKLAGGAPPPAADHGRLLYRSGAAPCADAGRLAIARGAGAEGWAALIAAAEAWTPKHFPLQGRDLIAAGMQPGPEVGALLRAVEDWWIGEAFEPDRTACLDRAAAQRRLSSRP